MKVSLTPFSAMRKLLVILNARMRDALINEPQMT